MEKIKTYLLFGSLLLLPLFSFSQWTQQGQDINGEAAGDVSGHAISLSADGTRLAISAGANDGDTGNYSDNRGHVRVYQIKAGDWQQLGQDIDGEAEGDGSGGSIFGALLFNSNVSLNADGSRVAIGAPRNDGNGEASGHVRIFEYNANLDIWEPLGLDIDGEASGDNFGGSVSLSADGNRVAIGAPGNNGGSGRVRFYEYNGASWQPLGNGNPIDGEAAGDNFGASLSLSSDGNFVAVGAPYHNNIGQVRIYQFNGADWNLLGNTIEGEAAGDKFGFSISLINDGNVVVAIGAPYHDGNTGDPDADIGHVQIYELPLEGLVWTKIGDIDGKPKEGYNMNSGWFGYSVSLNAIGTKIAISAPRYLSDGCACPFHGYNQVYEFDSINWIQQGDDIIGDNFSKSGYSVSLSGNGNKVAIGGPNKYVAENADGELSGGASGYVQVFFMPEACDANLIINQDVLNGGSDNQQASQNITATNTIFNNGTAIYHAGEHLLFQPGFYAQDGAVFAAYIEECTGDFQGRNQNQTITDKIDKSQNFTTGSENENNSKLVVFPNPFEGSVSFQFYTEQNAKVVLSIYDLEGKLQLEKQLNYQEEGQQVVEADLSTLPSGTYLYKLFVDKKPFTGKIIKK